MGITPKTQQSCLIYYNMHICVTVMLLMFDLGAIVSPFTHHTYRPGHSQTSPPHSYMSSYIPTRTLPNLSSSLKYVIIHTDQDTPKPLFLIHICHHTYRPGHSQTSPPHSYTSSYIPTRTLPNLSSSLIYVIIHTDQDTPKPLLLTHIRHHTYRPGHSQTSPHSNMSSYIPTRTLPNLSSSFIYVIIHTDQDTPKPLPLTHICHHTYRPGHSQTSPPHSYMSSYIPTRTLPNLSSSLIYVIIHTDQDTPKPLLLTHICHHTYRPGHPQTSPHSYTSSYIPTRTLPNLSSLKYVIIHTDQDTPKPLLLTHICHIHRSKWSMGISVKYHGWKCRPVTHSLLAIIT